jgi:hypothetical protein
LKSFTSQFSDSKNLFLLRKNKDGLIACEIKIRTKKIDKEIFFFFIEEYNIIPKKGGSNKNKIKLFIS